MAYAQTPQDRATELKKQAQSSLNQKDYIKARYLFKKHTKHLQAAENYPQAIECGVQANALYVRENILQRGIQSFAVTWSSFYGPENRIKRKSFMTCVSL